MSMGFLRNYENWKGKTGILKAFARLIPSKKKKSKYNHVGLKFKIFLNEGRGAYLKFFASYILDEWRGNEASYIAIETDQNNYLNILSAIWVAIYLDIKIICIKIYHKNI